MKRAAPVSLSRSTKALSVASVAALLLGACSLFRPSGEALFTPKLDACARDAKPCETECSSATPGSDACDALTILRAEDVVHTHERPTEDGALASLAANLHAACGRGHQRACAAEAPLAEELKSDAASREGQSAAAHADDLARQSVAIASLSDPAFTTCAAARTPSPLVHAACAAADLAEVLRKCVAGCDTCSAGCNVERQNAETALASAQKLAGDSGAASAASRQAADEKGARDRAAAAVETEEVLRQEQACLGDLPACKAKCAASAKSDSCGLLANIEAFGRGDQPVDLKDGTRLARAGCAAAGKSANKIACAVQKRLESESASCADDACKTFCDAAKCGYPPSNACLYADACGRIGDTILAASSTAGDQAAPWLEKGCAAGGTHSCSVLGRLYAAGTGIPKDLRKAEVTLKKACDLHLALTRNNANREADADAFERMQSTCKAYEDVVCMNKVETPAHRRATKDSVCQDAGGGATAWATLNGKDSDSCTAAMTKAGCTEVAGQSLYCCP